MSRFNPFPICLRYRKDFAETRPNRITGDFANELQDGGFCTPMPKYGKRNARCMISCAGNQQQHSPEMTGFPVRTERHCCGMVEGRGPSLDPAPPAVSPVRGFGVRRETPSLLKEIPTMSPNKITDTQLVLLSAAAQRGAADGGRCAGSVRRV
jgi:hypothetical protein